MTWEINWCPNLREKSPNFPLTGPCPAPPFLPSPVHRHVGFVCFFFPFRTTQIEKIKIKIIHLIEKKKKKTKKCKTDQTRKKKKGKKEKREGRENVFVFFCFCYLLMASGRRSGRSSGSSRTSGRSRSRSSTSRMMANNVNVNLNVRVSRIGRDGGRRGFLRRWRRVLYHCAQVYPIVPYNSLHPANKPITSIPNRKQKKMNETKQTTG